MTGRPPLSKQVRAARDRAANAVKIQRLTRRLDHYVEKGESFPKGGKTRARYLALADKAREELRIVEH